MYTFPQENISINYLSTFQFLSSNQLYTYNAHSICNFFSDILWTVFTVYRNCFVNKTTNKEIVKRNNDIALTLRRFQTVQIRQDNGRKKMAGTRQTLAVSLPDKEAHICPDPGLTIITCNQRRLHNYCQYSVLVNINDADHGISTNGSGRKI